MSPSSSSSAAATKGAEESKEQITTTARLSLLSPKGNAPPALTPSSRSRAASAAPSAAPTSRGLKSGASQRGKKEGTATSKKKKVKIVEDAAMVRRLVEHAAAGQVEALRHILQMEGDPRVSHADTASCTRTQLTFFRL